MLIAAFVISEVWPYAFLAAFGSLLVSLRLSKKWYIGILCAILWFIFTLGTNLPARLVESSGSTFYVATTGNDSTGDGSSGNPWATMNKLLTTLNGNQRGRIRPGTYNEGDLTCSRGGTAGNTITIEADDPSNPPIILGRINLTTSGATYWRFRNLINDANATFSSCWKPTSGANNIEWFGCESRNTTGAGGGWLCTQSTTNNLQWWNCLSHDNAVATTGTHGWYFNGGHHYYMVNCVSRDNGGYGLQCFTDTGQTLDHIYCYNSLFISSNLRAGVIISGDSVTVTSASLAAQDCHFYNCISAFNDGAGGSNRYGWYIHFAGFSDYTGYVKNTLDNCIAFGNTDGTLVADNAGASVINTNFITSDPLFQNRFINDFHLQSGIAGRAEPSLLKQNTLEGGTNGTTISNANSGGASGDAFSSVAVGSGNTYTFDNSSGKVTQTLGAKWVFGGTTIGTCRWTGLGSFTGDVWFRNTIYISAIPSVGNWFGFVQANTSASVRCAAIGLRTDGKIQVYDAAGVASTSSTSTTVLQINTLYRIEWRVNITSGEVEWWLYDSATKGAANFIEHKITTGLTLGANVDQYQTGVDSTPANVNGISVWYDDFGISTVDQLGPRGGSSFSPSPAIAAGLDTYTPTFDLDNQLRVNADIGPYLYGVAEYNYPKKVGLRRGK